MTWRRMATLTKKELVAAGKGALLVSLLNVVVFFAIWAYDQYRPEDGAVTSIFTGRWMLVASLLLYGWDVGRQQASEIASATFRHLRAFPVSPCEVLLAKGLAFLSGFVAIFAVSELCRHAVGSIYVFYPRGVAATVALFLLWSASAWAAQLCDSSFTGLARGLVWVPCLVFIFGYAPATDYLHLKPNIREFVHLPSFSLAAAVVMLGWIAYLLSLSWAIVRRRAPA